MFLCTVLFELGPINLSFNELFSAETADTWGCICAFIGIALKYDCSPGIDSRQNYLAALGMVLWDQLSCLWSSQGFKKKLLSYKEIRTESNPSDKLGGRIKETIDPGDMCLINQLQPQVHCLRSTVGLPQCEVGWRTPLTEDSVRYNSGSLIVGSHGSGILLPLYISVWKSLNYGYEEGLWLISQLKNDCRGPDLDIQQCLWLVLLDRQLNFDLLVLLLSLSTNLRLWLSGLDTVLPMTLHKDLRRLSSCSFFQTTHSATSMVYTLWSHKTHPDCSLLTALNMSFWAPLFQCGNFCGSLQQAFHVSPCASHAVSLPMLTRAQKQIMPLLSGCFFSIFLVTKATVLPMIYSSSQSPALASHSFSLLPH